MNELFSNKDSDNYYEYIKNYNQKYLYNNKYNELELDDYIDKDEYKDIKYIENIYINKIKENNKYYNNYL